ncbi:MAG TPA: hypothetical protein VFY37_06095 [Solirubrobacterales bacterium]|nr:hypothetical protein [Solirubrobacterales bacterium]
MYHAIVRRRARAHLETERVADACRRMAAAGIEEAAAPPITA